MARYLAAENLPAELVMAPDPALDAIPWDDAAAAADPARPGRGRAMRSSLTPCLAAIAETGTLMLVSGAETPTTLNFLPDTHIVVRARRPGRGELRGRLGPGARGPARAEALPRTVNLITGPSRTGDIEQRIQLGAHGPRRLHIVLVDDRGTPMAMRRLSADEIGAVAAGDARCRAAARPRAGAETVPAAGVAGTRRVRVDRANAAAAHGPPLPSPPLPPLDRFAGIDRATAERLKRGRYPIEARLDLHGMTQAEAHRALAGLRRGARAPPAGAACWSSPAMAGSSGGVLKQRVPRWLAEPELRRHVLAIAPAQPRDGGAGALYLLLRRRRAEPRR